MRQLRIEVATPDEHYALEMRPNTTPETESIVQSIVRLQTQWERERDALRRILSDIQR